MFNNAVVEVAIGLIFIYLLYSLLATTIQEFIATLFSYRARMLEKGLEQMLDGKSFSYYWWDRLWNYINRSNKTKETSKFHKKKSLFTNLISCHPLYIRSGENSSILKNDKPSYLSADVFSDILIDVLKPNGDIPALLKDIAASVKVKAANENDPLNSDLEKILTLYIEQANGDLQRFKLLIETWYNETMERVGGWYKRQANRILIGIGLCLAIAFNVSTIDVVRKLSEDKDVRNALVTNATDYVKNHINNVKIPAKGATETSRNNGVLNTADSAKNDSGSVNPLPAKIADTTNADTTFDALRSKVDSMKELYNNNIAEANTTLGIGWANFGLTDITIDSLRKQYDTLYAQYKKDSIAYIQCTQQPKAECEKPDKPKQKWVLPWYEKLWYIIWHTLSNPHYWIGFLITAFAISLGAPFWFDLLNRFVNLRVSGAKPEDTTSTTVSKTVLLNQKPDPTAKE